MANQIKDEILALMAPGGDSIGGDHDDKIADDDLLKSIGALVAGGASATKVAEALDAPSSVVSATLRRNRRKIAILFYQLTADRMAELTQEQFTIAKRVVDELNRRLEDPEFIINMKTDELIKLLNTMAKWIVPISQTTLFPPEPAPTKAAPVPLTQLTVNALIGQIHHHKERAEHELSDVRGLRLERGLPGREESDFEDSIDATDEVPADAREKAEADLATDRSPLPNLK